MYHLSEYFSQVGHRLFGANSLDCFDLDFENDSKLFIDPTKIALSNNNMFDENSACTRIYSFFEHLLDLKRAGQQNVINNIISNIHEINDTHLGLSKDQPKGKGPSYSALGESIDTIQKIVNQAAITGDLPKSLLFDIFVPNFSDDSFSDVITNIIYHELNEYTLNVINAYHLNIPVHQCAPNSHHYWNNNQWENLVTQDFLFNGKTIVFIPNDFVIKNYDFSSNKYMNSTIVEYVKKDWEAKNPDSKTTKDDIYKLIRSNYPSLTNKQIEETYTMQDTQLLTQFLN